MNRQHLLHALLYVLCMDAVCHAAFQNVTTILAAHPNYSSFNALLSEYGVALQINRRTAITVLCPPNRITDAFMAAGRGSSLDRLTLFNILSFHVLLAYEDPVNLRSPHSTLTTLFQTTGLATGTSGFLTISLNRTTGTPVVRLPDLASPATIGPHPIDLFPYNISLLSIDAVLVPTGLIGAPAPQPVNITQIMAQAGSFSRFVALLTSSGVDRVYQSHDAPPGLTIFAPSDAAFGKLSARDAARLAAETAAVLKCHAMVSFFPTEELSSAVGPQPTLAGGPFTLVLTASGSDVTVDAGYGTATVASALYSNNPVAILAVDAVLLPAAIFGRPSLTPSQSSPSPAPTLLPSPPPSAAVPPAPSLFRSPSASRIPTPSPLVSSPPPPPPRLTTPPAPSPTFSSNPTSHDSLAPSPSFPTSASSSSTSRSPPLALALIAIAFLPLPIY